ncbi:uncharacterized protein LOC123259327 isoform X2 [Cotesia glomerata]|uniref:uncharacterized protein LOC123259327 isoform X2 n=1 Tax=Cotesia glomerata TaxID=32391 RepID=UPI001D02A358|nr:uncharacterized protein LOC123259327 isoform X2 [Cotesia glomerata]
MANNRKRRGSYIDSLPDRVFDGYVFRQGRHLKDGARRLICSHAESDACNAQGTLSATDDFTYVRNRSKHTHERDPDAELKARFIRDLYIATKHEFRNLEIIYNDVSLIHQEGAALLSFDTINRRMQTWLESRVFPGVASIDDIKLKLESPHFKNINLHNAGKTEIVFLQNDEGQNVSMVLYDSILLTQLQPTTLFIQSTQQLFEDLDALQLTAISAEYKDHILPLIWIIQVQKNEESCKIIFRKILNLQPNFSPTKIYFDFDDDYWRALNAVFPGVIIKGMFLNHCKIMTNKVHRLNLDLKDSTTISTVSKLISISLLPENLMEYYNQHWLTSIKVENYCFYNDIMSLWKNGELILQSMISRLEKSKTVWSLIEQVSLMNSQIHFHRNNLMTKGHFIIHSRKVKNIFTNVKNCKYISDLWTKITAGTVNSTDFVIRIANHLIPVLRNLLLSDVEIPAQFKLLKLFINEAAEPPEDLPQMSANEVVEVDATPPVDLVNNLTSLDHNYNLSSDPSDHEETSDPNINPDLIDIDNDSLFPDVENLSESIDDNDRSELPNMGNNSPELGLREGTGFTDPNVMSESTVINSGLLTTASENEIIISSEQQDINRSYIYAQQCLGCFNDLIEVGYKPCNHAPFCWSCNNKWHDEAIANGELFTCILCRTFVEIADDLRADC